MGIMLVLVFSVGWWSDTRPFDSTDHAEKKLRSGANLVTDYLTGCQYLAAAKGGITPRRDGQGNHLGCEY